MLLNVCIRIVVSSCRKYRPNIKGTKAEVETLAPQKDTKPKPKPKSASAPPKLPSKSHAKSPAPAVEKQTLAPEADKQNPAPEGDISPRPAAPASSKAPGTKKGPGRCLSLLVSYP